jgi:hypothetical protein
MDQSVEPCSKPGLARRFGPQEADGVADVVTEIVEELSTLEVLDTSDDVLEASLEDVADDVSDAKLELSVELEDGSDELELGGSDTLALEASELVENSDVVLDT